MWQSVEYSSFSLGPESDKYRLMGGVAPQQRSSGQRQCCDPRRIDADLLFRGRIYKIFYDLS